jgi:hypothetical protein
MAIIKAEKKKKVKIRRKKQQLSTNQKVYYYRSIKKELFYFSFTLHHPFKLTFENLDFSNERS